jgi:hypothetical protein
MDERSGSTRVKFLVAWSLALAAKLWLVLALQPFGDEAFYAQESTRLAWAYSDLPGLTAWRSSRSPRPTIFAKSNARW